MDTITVEHTLRLQVTDKEMLLRRGEEARRRAGIGDGEQARPGTAEEALHWILCEALVVPAGIGVAPDEERSTTSDEPEDIVASRPG